MTAVVRLPRMLSETANTASQHSVEGSSVSAALADLFAKAPGLRNHIVDEKGSVRPHVSVFVDGVQADIDTEVGEGAEIRILHAVSGGSSFG